MNIQELKNIQISDLLANHGFLPKSKHGSNWWYLSPLHSERTASFKIDINKNVWYDFGIGKGGNIVALAQLLYETTDISQLLQRIGHLNVSTAKHYTTNIPKENTPSFTNIEVGPLRHHALVNYLSSRGIGYEIACSRCVEVHYKIQEKTYFAIGFKNDNGGYELRNPYFKGCIAPKGISCINSGSDTCRVFEGFIDYLSYVVLHGDCLAVVLNSITNTERAVDTLREYPNIICHLDNDRGGKNALEILRKALGNRIMDASHEYEGYNDLNEYLCKQPLSINPNISYNGCKTRI